MNIDTTTTIKPATDWANLLYHETENELYFYSENEQLSVENVSPSNIILMFRNEICCCPENALQNQDGLMDYDTDRLREVYETLKEFFKDV